MVSFEGTDVSNANIHKLDVPRLEPSRGIHTRGIMLVDLERRDHNALGL